MHILCYIKNMKNNDIILDKNYIEQFAQPINPLYSQNVFNYVCEKFDFALKDIIKKSPVVSDYDFKMVNECATQTETQSSSLDIFLSIKSPKLEMSVLKLNKNLFKKFFNKLKIAYYESKREKQEKKRRKKNKLNDDNNNIMLKKTDFSYDKYNINDFKKELLQNLVKYFSNGTILYTTDYGITLESKSELGMTVNVYIVIENGKMYRIFNSSNFKLTSIDFGQRFANFEVKNYETNYNYQKAVRLFNSLFVNLMNYSLNQIYIESLLYNCPNKLFEGSTYEMFLKIFNYVTIESNLNCKSITNENINVLNDNLAKINIYDFNKFLKILASLL